MRPTHGGAVMKPVGSTAVRDAILKYQPMLSVHGHIHESRGVKQAGPDPGHEPGQRLQRRRAAGRGLDLNEKKGKVDQVHPRQRLSSEPTRSLTGKAGADRANRPDRGSPGRDDRRSMDGRSTRREPTLFLRKATGLVRGWSVRDSMIYACLSTNVVTLGIYECSFQSSFPKGQLLTSILISGVWVSFLVIAYTGLVVTIPRAGGDYVWQSRILGSGLGFVMAATGWWFILWLWAPIYGNILSVSSSSRCGPRSADQRRYVLRHPHRDLRGHADHDRAGRLPGLARHGRLRPDPEVVLLRRPGRLRGHRRSCCWSTATAASCCSFNLEAHKLFGDQQRLRHDNAAAVKTATSPRPSASARSAPSMLLVPMMMFYLLWPNWGTTLYGEIRGASDFRRVFSGMFSACGPPCCWRWSSCCCWPRRSAGPSTRTSTRRTGQARPRCRSGRTR